MKNVAVLCGEKCCKLYISTDNFLTNFPYDAYSLVTNWHPPLSAPPLQLLKTNRIVLDMYSVCNGVIFLIKMQSLQSFGYIIGLQELVSKHLPDNYFWPWNLLFLLVGLKILNSLSKFPYSHLLSHFITFSSLLYAL